MIAINLLKDSIDDARQLRRRRLGECVLGLCSLGVVCLGLAFIWIDANQRIHLLREDLTAKQGQMASQARFESDVKALVEQKEDLMEGVSRLEDIQRLRMQSAYILETVSRSLDPLDLWLVTMQLDKGRLVLDGLAGSREEIFKFWNNLESHPLFKDVIISETRAELIAEEPLYSFSMDLQIIDAEHVGSTPS